MEVINDATCYQTESPKRIHRISSEKTSLFTSVNYIQ